jgi:hypothetical protein
LAAAIGTLLSGVFLTGFPMSLGASRLEIGMLAALPPLASMAQLAGARMLGAGVNRKRLCVGALTASRLTWAAVLLIPWLAADRQQWALAALIAVVGASSLLGSLAGVAWLSWIRDLVPADKRLGLLSFRSQLNTVLALVLGVAGNAVVATAHQPPGAALGVEAAVR